VTETRRRNSRIVARSRRADDSSRAAQIIRLLPALNLKPQEAGEGISQIEEVIKSLA